MKTVDNNKKIKAARKYLHISAWDFDAELQLVNDCTDRHGLVFDGEDYVDVVPEEKEGYEKVEINVGIGENARKETYWANIID